VTRKKAFSFSSSESRAEIWLFWGFQVLCGDRVVRAPPSPNSP
jgi:hypothetical protein